MSGHQAPSTCTCHACRLTAGNEATILAADAEDAEEKAREAAGAGGFPVRFERIRARARLTLHRGGQA